MDTERFTKRIRNSRIGAPVRHNNPDGSLGGYVDRTAEVNPQAIIESGAIVMPGARILEAIRIKRNQIVGPDGAIIEMAESGMERK